jgi:hypothetical protein
MLLTRAGNPLKFNKDHYLTKKELTLSLLTATEGHLNNDDS